MHRSKHPEALDTTFFALSFSETATHAFNEKFQIDLYILFILFSTVQIDIVRVTYHPNTATRFPREKSLSLHASSF